MNGTKEVSQPTSLTGKQQLFSTQSALPQYFGVLESSLVFL